MMQVGMALTPNSLARRKSGVQIPSPPPQHCRSERRQHGAGGAHCMLRPPPPTTTVESKPTPPLAQRGLRSLNPPGSGEPVVDTAGEHADPGHPSHAAACPTAALHDLTPVGHSGRGNARTPDAHSGHRTPDTRTLRRPHRTLDTGRVDRHVWRLDVRTGHWTPAAGRGCGHADEGTPASAPPGPPRPAAARWA